MGRPCNLVFGTLDADGQRSQPFRTLFLQELITRGIVGPSFVVSAALSDEDIDRTVEAVDQALAVYARRALGRHRRLPARPPRQAGVPPLRLRSAPGAARRGPSHTLPQIRPARAPRGAR